MKITTLLAALLLICAAAQAGWDAGLEPWAAPGRDFEDWDAPERPRPREAWERLAAKNTPAPDILWPPSLIASDLLWLYQHTVSGKTGGRCPFYPSCSRYSRIAVETYGLTLGVIMTGERYSRCHEHAGQDNQYERKRVDREFLFWNPPQLDAWWDPS